MASCWVRQQFRGKWHGTTGEFAALVWDPLEGSLAVAEGIETAPSEQSALA